MLLVASETGHVYTFATRKLQPMITSESGKALIQTCLNSPDPPVSQIPNPDQRMSATGYEETDLTYTVNENDADKMQVSGIFELEFTVQYSSHLLVSLYVLYQRLKILRDLIYASMDTLFERLVIRFFSRVYFFRSPGYLITNL